jgi:hypothetical protein
MRVHYFDNRGPLRPVPTLDLLLSLDGTRYPTECLESNAFGHVIFLCEARDCLLFMFGDSAHQIIRHSGIENIRPTGENIDMEGSIHENCVILARRHSERSEESLRVGPQSEEGFLAPLGMTVAGKVLRKVVCFYERRRGEVT